MHSDAHYSKAALNIELVILLRYMSEMTAHMNVKETTVIFNSVVR